MEGLIPLILRSMRKQTRQNSYRSISENSVTGRSYHLLLAGDSKEGGSSHRRTRSEFQPPSTAYHLDMNKGLNMSKSQRDYKD